MTKYHQHPLALTDEEEKDFQEVKSRTGYGPKKIFMAMVAALKTPPTPITEEEQ